LEIASLQPAGRQLIQGYGKGAFLVSDRTWRGAILVFPDRVVAWNVGGLSALTEDSFAPLRDAEPPPEIVLVGPGPRMAMLSASLRATLRASGLAVETMDTGAACRTYNLLAGEERRVVAALLPLD